MMYMDAHCTATEKEFAQAFAPMLYEGLGVQTSSIHHDESSGVLHVELVFDAMNRELRHRVLDYLATVEAEFGGRVETSPTFVWT